ncbi:hypothetical protein ABMB67_002218 [Halalkalibacter oceani]
MKIGYQEAFGLLNNNKEPPTCYVKRQSNCGGLF